MKCEPETADDGLTRRRFIKGSARAVIAAGLLSSVDLRAATLDQQASLEAVK